MSFHARCRHGFCPKLVPACSTKESGQVHAEDCAVLLQGVYCGGLQHANALVKAGHVAVHRFKLLAGYMGWEPGQLSREVRPLRGPLLQGLITSADGAEQF